MIGIIRNIFHWMKGLKALENEQNLEAYEHFKKIKTSRDRLKVEVLVFKAYTTCFLLENEYSISFLKEALMVLNGKNNIKRWSSDDIKYVELYIYRLLSVNYSMTKNTDGNAFVNAKKKQLSVDFGKARKFLIRNFPMDE